MKIRDIMNCNVVTIPSSTSIAEARRLMEAHRIKRLPVVDKGKLVGIVTSRGLDRVSPGQATSLSIWELSYLLQTTPVKDFMAKDVFTVHPDDDSEWVVAEAQKRQVGSAVVLEDKHVVGIVTSDDFFDKVIGPLLGVGLPGDRIEIAGAVFPRKGPGQLEKMIAVVRKFGYKIMTIHIEGDPLKQESLDVCFHVYDGQDIDALITEFQNQGYQARLRKR